MYLSEKINKFSIIVVLIRTFESLDVDILKIIHYSGETTLSTPVIYCACRPLNI